MTRKAKPYLGESSADFLRTLDPITANELVRELEALPALEAASASVISIPDPHGDYRALAVPSGFAVVYRNTVQARNRLHHWGLMRMLT